MWGRRSRPRPPPASPSRNFSTRAPSPKLRRRLDHTATSRCRCCSDPDLGVRRMITTYNFDWQDGMGGATFGVGTAFLLTMRVQTACARYWEARPHRHVDQVLPHDGDPRRHAVPPPLRPAGVGGAEVRRRHPAVHDALLLHDDAPGAGQVAQQLAPRAVPDATRAQPAAGPQERRGRLRQVDRVAPRPPRVARVHVAAPAPRDERRARRHDRRVQRADEDRARRSPSRSASSATSSTRCTATRSRSSSPPSLRARTTSSSTSSAAPASPPPSSPSPSSASTPPPRYARARGVTALARRAAPAHPPLTRAPPPPGARGPLGDDDNDLLMKFATGLHTES